MFYYKKKTYFEDETPIESPKSSELSPFPFTLNIKTLNNYENLREDLSSFYTINKDIVSLPHLAISPTKASSSDLWMKIYKDVLNPWLPKSPSLLKNKYLKDVLSNNEGKLKKIATHFQHDHQNKKDEKINPFKMAKINSSEKKTKNDVGNAHNLPNTFFPNKSDEKEIQKLSKSMIITKSEFHANKEEIIPELRRKSCDGKLFGFKSKREIRMILENCFTYKKIRNKKPNPSISQTLIKPEIKISEDKKGIFPKSTPNSVSNISNANISKGQSTKNNHYFGSSGFFQINTEGNFMNKRSFLIDKVESDSKKRMSEINAMGISRKNSCTAISPETNLSNRGSLITSPENKEAYSPSVIRTSIFGSMRNSIAALTLPRSSLQGKDNFTQSTNEDFLTTEQNFFFNATKNNELEDKVKRKESLKWKDWNFTPLNTKSKLSIMLRERGKNEEAKNSIAKPYVSNYDIKFLNKERKNKDQIEMFQKKRKAHQIKSEDASYVVKCSQYENVKNLIFYRNKLTKKRKDLENQIKKSAQLIKLSFI